ncbi:MAG: hypothetical protein M1819_005565 [Sarea resinae]|nr:MAG: hypothetical protein M1819_005565 [Sarea resinae]
MGDTSSVDDIIPTYLIDEFRLQGCTTILQSPTPNRMPAVQEPASSVCARCLRVRRLCNGNLLSTQYGGQSFRRRVNSPLAQTVVRRQHGKSGDSNDRDAPKTAEKEEEEGAMSRRLSEMTDDSIAEGGRGGRRAVEDAGFSEELKRKLEEKIQAGNFRSENASAFAQINMPSSAGKGTRDIAAAQPWTGTEALEDAALRMLTDAHKPLRGGGPAKIPTPRGIPPPPVKRKAPAKSAGHRIVNARERSSTYTMLKDPNMSEKEREQMRKELKERFTPGARPMPTSVQGLASLANERIEDAIARGQFKNLPRGKAIERDYNASSPFLDTTEYFMNKIIQKQEIVPPWIEKQQELVKAANVFRSRLRNDWKRHAVRLIASEGGSLESQLKRAEEYARAEARENPTRPKVEAMNAIDEEGRLSKLVILEKPTSSSDQPTLSPSSPSSTSTSSSTSSSTSTSSPPSENKEPTTEIHVTSATISTPTNSPPSPPPSPSSPPPPPPRPPFRDPTWLATESAYHALSITTLNNLTRSYNLMAPDLAKKPYFRLERELLACYADVAPQLAPEILARARAPKNANVDLTPRVPGAAVLERFGAGDKARVFDSRKPNYGFREFWKDIWGKGQGG